jgi:hypothetical protein
MKERKSNHFNFFLKIIFLLAWMIAKYISQLPITIPKFLKSLTYKQKNVILADGSRDFRPSLDGLIALDL